jgi:O-acetyl-ADP-ribose deacetylase (regulator of RNase III)
MKLQLELVEVTIEQVDADALLLPVNGQLCRLGGAAAGALRLALAPDERADELDYVEDQLARLRPVPHPQARLIDGAARWSKLLVSAAYPHNVDGVIQTPDDCARMIRNAIPAALALAEAHQLASVAATLIGTAYRMSAELAVRAFVDGLRAAAAHHVAVRWSLPDATHRQLAAAAASRIGIPVRG